MVDFYPEDHEIRAWLGDDWTPEQAETIVERALAWERERINSGQHADEDEREAAWTAIAQQVDGVLAFDQVASRYGYARAEVEAAKEAARAAVWVQISYGDMTESEASRTLGVDRMTIRSWLGKKR